METGKYVETKAINMKVGQSLELFQRDWETEEDMLLNNVEIAALTDQFPMGIIPAGVGGLNIIVSEQVMDQTNWRAEESANMSMLFSS